MGETDIARNEAPCNGEEIVATMTECGDGDATTPTEVLKSLVADGSILTSIEVRGEHFRRCWISNWFC